MMPPMVRLACNRPRQLKSGPCKSIAQKGKPISAPMKAQIKITSSSEPGTVHDVQITGIFDMAGYVCQYAQCQTDNGGVAAAMPSMPSFRLAPRWKQRCYAAYGDEAQTASSPPFVRVSHEGHEVGIVKAACCS